MVVRREGGRREGWTGSGREGACVVESAFAAFGFRRNGEEERGRRVLMEGGRDRCGEGSVAVNTQVGHKNLKSRANV